jgi:membrane protease subunit (stomatin/prohibitin family)
MCIISGTIALATTLGTALGASAAVGTGIAGVGTAAAWAGGAAMGVGGLAISGAATGGVMSAVSSIQQANAAQGQAENAATMAGHQEQMNKDKERQVADSGAFEKWQQNLRQAALMGDHQVEGAANSVMLGTGSMLDWEESSAEVFEENNRQLDYDIKNRKYSARIGTWNASITKNNANARANAYEDQIPMLAVGGIVNTFSNTASSALNIGSGLMKFKTA